MHEVPKVLGEAGRFAVQRELGRGEFAVVYLARDRKLDELVALKLLRRQALRQIGLKRFRKEFAISAGLRHPNLARHYELLCDAGDWFFTMELVEGPDFVEYARRDLSSDGGRNSEAVCTAYGQPVRLDRNSEFAPCTARGMARLRRTLPQLVSAVTAIHDARLVHCDLQPGNVRVTFDDRVVVLDYGLALTSASTDDPASRPGPVGVPAYMAPEQWDRMATGPASDWYAVGSMLFEALTGAPPFTGGAQELVVRKRTVSAPRPSTLVGGIPVDLDELVADLLQTDPRQRPQGRDLLRRLQASRKTASGSPRS